MRLLDEKRRCYNLSSIVILTLVTASAAAMATSARAQTAQVIDASAPGAPFSRGVRGQAAPALHTSRNEYHRGIPQVLAVSRGSSVRGYAGGLEADIFNWKNRNDDARPTVLQYQRYARDYDAEMVFTANVRGLTRLTPTPTSPYQKEFYDTSTATLTSLAADWVRYSNRITQLYRQGATVVDVRDRAVLNSLRWNTGPGDAWETLPRAGESVPKIKYWEIGNEPLIRLDTTYQVTNSYTFGGATGNALYRDRYLAMTAAMLAEDPTIKVGPCLVGGSSETGILNALLSSSARVDFISYHPYQGLGANTTPSQMKSGLSNIYTRQKGFIDFLQGRMTANGRDPSRIELIASEINVSNWSTNDKAEEARMGHALGSVETVFSLARLGVHAAHYWLWPANVHDGTEYPVYKAYQGLRDHMGDTMLGVYSTGATRVYTTRDSRTREIALWGLNFDEDANAVVNMSLRGLTGNEKVTLMTLGSLSGDTSLNTSVLASGMTAGPTTPGAVGWTSTDLTGRLNFGNFNFMLPDATISVLFITPAAVPEPASLLLAGASFGTLMLRRRVRRRAI